MMENDTMGRGGMMHGGMMCGRMGFGPWAEKDHDGHCPMCGSHGQHEGGRRFLSKEERKDFLNEYLKELEAEAKAVKEVIEEDK